MVRECNREVGVFEVRDMKVGCEGDNDGGNVE